MLDGVKELKPCPFCGGEAETLTAESMHGGYLFVIMCDDCCSRGGVYDTEAEAIEAWNTRAEMSQEDIAILLDELGVSERTCHAELNESRNAVICSECGSSELLRGWEEFKSWEGSVCISTFTTHKYCPNCGAKVVE